METSQEKDKYISSLLLIEEEMSEKIANYWRIGIALMFFAVTAAVAKEIPPHSIKVLLWGTTSYFLFSIYMFFFLRSGRYKPWLKYFSVSVDIGLTTLAMWSFGTFRTFKTEAFLLYYMWIGLATMRLSTRLTLFTGFLSLGCYIMLVILAITFNTIETGSISDSFISPKVSLLNQALKFLYMTIVIIAVTYGSRAYHRLATEAHRRERDAERQSMRNQKLESIGFLAGGIAHDFNNALAIITNNLHIITACSGEKEKVTAKAQAAISAAMKATSLTQQLLTFSKGGAPLKKAVPVDKLIENTAWLALTGSAIKYKIEQLPPDLRLVKIDEGQISQVLNNIFINAAHASPVGGSITIRAENFCADDNSNLSLEPGEYVKLSIIDQGTGIPPDIAPKIFDPYFTTKETGSGLGLATAHSIIKRHNGHIEVDSVPSVGTTVNLYLPATDEPYLNETGKAESSDHGSLRILIMDDAQAFLDSTGEALVISGHDVAFARDGAECLELYRNRMDTPMAFNLVIMDLTIPGGMGGADTITRLKAMDPQARVIASSGYSNDPVMSDFRSFGFSGILPKPFTQDQMQYAISSVLDNDPA